MSRNLFEDEAEEGATTSDFKINRNWADKYDQVKRKQELQQLASKYGNQFVNDAGESGGGGGGADDEEEEEVGAEDEHGDLITDEHETEFASLLLKLKRNDPDIANPEAKFFSERAPIGGNDGDDDEAGGDGGDATTTSANNKNKKAFSLKDEYQRSVLMSANSEGGGGAAAVVDEDDDYSSHSRKRITARTEEEKRAKKAFLGEQGGQQGGGGGGDGDDDDFSFSVRKSGTIEDLETIDPAEAERRKKIKRKKEKMLNKAFAVEEGDDADEAFLKDFFREEKWKLEDGEDDDDYDENNMAAASAAKITTKKNIVTGTSNQNIAVTKEWEQKMKEEQDEQFYDDAEVWEQEYQQAQYRHQEGEEAMKIQTFARQQEGLLRNKDAGRHDARQRKSERKQEQESKFEQDVKRLKHLKRKEIESQRERIATVAGISKEKMEKLQKMLDAELTGGADFDSANFDKTMQSLFDDDYYENCDDEEVELMELEHEYDNLQNDDDDDDGGNEDGTTTSNKTNSIKNNIGGDVGNDDDDAADDDDEEDALLYPTRFAEKHMQQLVERNRQEKQEQASGNSSRATTKSSSKAFSTAQDVHHRLKKDLDSKVDEYWKLHHEDILADGTRTRFRYRQVAPESFGLTDEDILTSDDRTLNMVAPMNCYAAYLTPEQNRKDKYRSIHRAETLRFLDPERKSRRYASDTVAIDVKQVSEEKGEEIASATAKIASAAAAVDSGRHRHPHKGSGPNNNNNNNNNNHGHPQRQHQQQQQHQQHQQQQHHPAGQRPQQQQQRPRHAGNQQSFQQHQHRQGQQQQHHQQQHQGKHHPARESGKRRQRDE